MEFAANSARKTQRK